MSDQSEEYSLRDAIGIEWAEATPDPTSPGYYELHDSNSELFGTLSEAVQRVSVLKQNPSIYVQYWRVRCPSLNCEPDDVDWIEILDGPDQVHHN